MNNPSRHGGQKEAPANMSEPETDIVKETQPQGCREIGGRRGPEPTRYGDWEKGGRCIDF